MKPYFIVNPVSAAGKTRARFQEALQVLKPEIPKLDFAYTAAPMEAKDLTIKALKQGFDTIISCGGDGTNNEVLNGFLLPEGAQRNPYAVLGFFPSGTGGDLRRTMDLPENAEDLVDYLRYGQAHNMDVGELEFINRDKGKEKRFFLNILSFGMSGLVDHYVNNAPKVLGGKVSFLIGTIRAAFKYRNLPVRIVLDGRPVYDGPVKLVAIANGRYFGGGMMVAPDASIDDGLFDVVIFKDLSLVDFGRSSDSIYTGKHVNHPKVEVHKARTISAVGPYPLLLDMDGEEAGSTPIKANCLHMAVKVLQMPAA